MTFSPGLVLGAQRLAEPALVVRDQVRGGGEDVAGGAVVALQPDHLGAGEVALEAQDVVDLGAAPAVDRLVVVADAADVLRRRQFVTRGKSLVASRHRSRHRPLREQPQPQVLGDVGVLVLVDQDVAEAVLVLGQHVRVLAKQPDDSSSRSPKSPAFRTFSRSWYA